MSKISSMTIKTALLFAVTIPVLHAQNSSGSGRMNPLKPRIVVTADPELDDSNSLVRFLLYSTDYSVEGLIYASSQFHWKGDGKGTKWFVPGREYTRFGLKDICPCTSWRWKEDERFIHEAVETYEKVYPNLRIHSPDYPTPAHLKSVIRYGNIEFDGDMSKNTEGSDFIKSLILDEKGGPLYLTAWGGQSTIARALKSIQDQYEKTPGWAALQDKISSKVIILPSGDQDDTGAKYIKPNWPKIRNQGGSGIPLTYGAQRGLSQENAEYYSAKWTRENISSRGPLGSFWRIWGDGKQMVKGDIFDYFGLSGYTDDQLKAMGYVVWMPIAEKGSFLGEGDSGTFMALLDTGLRSLENNMTMGGWGGGIRRSAVAPNVSPDILNPNFIPAVWRDFASRMKWSVVPIFKGANHKPRVKVQGPLDISARPGATIKLLSTASDPDKDSVSVKWWQYRNAGTYPGEIKILNSAALKTSFRVPDDAEPGATIHVVAEATDNGSPALTHYQHMIITVQGSR